MSSNSLALQKSLNTLNFFNEIFVLWWFILHRISYILALSNLEESEHKQFTHSILTNIRASTADTFIFLKGLPHQTYASRVGVAFSFHFAKGHWGKMPCLPLWKQTDFLTLPALAHPDSSYREWAEKRNAEAFLGGNTHPGGLERFEKGKLSSQKQICFFYICLKQSKLKKKNQCCLGRRKEAGKWALWKFL